MTKYFILAHNYQKSRCCVRISLLLLSLLLVKVTTSTDDIMRTLDNNDNIVGDLHLSPPVDLTYENPKVFSDLYWKEKEEEAHLKSRTFTEG